MAKILDLHSATQTANDKQSRMAEFEKMLERLDSTVDEKKRFLWKDVYRNAYEERETAYKLFNNAYSGSTATDTEAYHIEVGPILVKYLERASKANEQLLKLASMVEEAEKEDGEKSMDAFRQGRSIVSGNRLKG
jgi:hypothetical protein